MNILILSYACEPSAGSEYEVGLRVPTVMARLYPGHEVYVVTRGKVDFSEYSNLHYLHYDIPSWMKYPDEMGSSWGEQINYALWQLMVRSKVKRWCREYNIDVVHHLTFNQYRTPSPGYWMDVPFLLGPVGGAECISSAFYQDLETHTLRKERIRVKGLDRKIFQWFLSRKDTKKTILLASQENVTRLRDYCGNHPVKLLPAIGISSDEFAAYIIQDESLNQYNTTVESENTTLNSEYQCQHVLPDETATFNMICASKAWDWKGLHFVLKALSLISSDAPRMRFQIIGIRTDEEKERVNAWTRELRLENMVQLIPYLKREELLRIESECDMAVYPAFRDSGSMAVLEACALGCPSICFDAGGQDVFPDDKVIKIPVEGTYYDCLRAFADKLLWAYNNINQLKLIGRQAQKWALTTMTWEKKVDEFVKEYESLVR